MAEEVITQEMRDQAQSKMHDLLRECGSEDDKLGCVTDLLATIPEEVKAICRPQLFLLTQEDCEVCAESKTELKPMLDSGVIKERKIFMGDGKRIAQKNNLTMAPSLVLVDCQDNLLAEL